MPIIATNPRTPEAPPETTGSPTTKALGAACLAGLVALLLFAFVFSPPDERVDPQTNVITGQFDAVRLYYVHVPMAILAYVAFTITAVGSAMVLWKRSRWWDIAASSAAEVGVLFCGLTLVTGSIWGRPIWNTWWEWGDVRLMTTLMLFLIYVGYLAYRRALTDFDVRAKRSAILGLVGVVNIVLVNRSVEWWENRTLHQKSTFAGLEIEDLTLFTLMLGLVVFGAIFTWLLIHRFRIGWLEHQLETAGLERAIAERRAQSPAAVAQALDHPGVRPRGGGS